MSDKFTFTIDGVEVEAAHGQTILEAAKEAGVYIPTLCAFDGLSSHGSCRVCTVRVNGRPQPACVQPAAPMMEVDNETEELRDVRANIIEMLFVEGNHFCMFCEKSGNCELQALAYRFGVAAPRHEYLFPVRKIDASHADVFIDRNRCVLCGRCVRASQEQDGKNVFQFVGRGPHKRVAVNSDNHKLGASELKAADKAANNCPVGAIVRKRKGFEVPVGQRLYDHKPIGSDIEASRSQENK